ncbi:hypothetical protein MUN84_20010 [Hymenobacter sp. 5516J-16]|uniref:hypothetical protein n=1 Tax=Hymenobacter sp. 5516J-16 TaxID=2932253 RepID=UPI001FD55316|nr:hypothetical protein [Hymenobacter sp. 5516J-16]UOQ76766.1 hypothetical protein MUN84_20010 [Hymenobacter sp. 5516J-16]
MVSIQPFRQLVACLTWWAALAVGVAAFPTPATAQIPRLPPLAAQVGAPVQTADTIKAQSDTSRLSRRLPVLAGGLVVSYSGTLYLLSQGWYTGERSRLHWFNDWPEWKQLDKAGHFWGLFTKAGGR